MIATASVVLAALTTVVTAAHPTSWFTRSYPAGLVPALRTLSAKNPRAKVLADVRYADWLIWEDPKLFSGRVAYDTSFELLTPTQLSVIANLSAPTRSARTLVDEFGIWVLYRGNHRVNGILLHRPHVHVIGRRGTAIIAINGAGTRA